jgi:hypothetical protein
MLLVGWWLVVAEWSKVLCLVVESVSTITCRLELGCGNAKEKGEGRMESMREAGKRRDYIPEIWALPCLRVLVRVVGVRRPPPPDPRSLEGWDEKPFPLLREQVGLSRLAHRVVPFHKSANFDWAPLSMGKAAKSSAYPHEGAPCGTSGHVLARVWP